LVPLNVAWIGGRYLLHRPSAGVPWTQHRVPLALSKPGIPNGSSCNRRSPDRALWHPLAVAPTRCLPIRSSMCRQSCLLRSISLLPASPPPQFGTSSWLSLLLSPAAPRECPSPRPKPPASGRGGRWRDAIPAPRRQRERMPSAGQRRRQGMAQSHATDPEKVTQRCRSRRDPLAKHDREEVTAKPNALASPRGSPAVRFSLRPLFNTGTESPQRFAQPRRLCVGTRIPGRRDRAWRDGICGAGNAPPRGAGRRP
jgi:hypothetical protein